MAPQAEARDHAARVAIEARLTTSADAFSPTTPSAGRWSFGKRSPPDSRPSGGAALQEDEQPRSTSPMMRAAQALRRRLSPRGKMTTDARNAGNARNAASAAAAASQLYVGTREASAEVAPSVPAQSMEAMPSREVAPTDSKLAAKTEPTPTAAKQNAGNAPNIIVGQQVCPRSARS